MQTLRLTSLILLFTLSASATPPAIERPRIGIETETAPQNDDGQVISVPTFSERDTKTKEILNFWRGVFGGSVYRENNKWILDLGQEKTGWFSVDREWASDQADADGYEVVTPPFDEAEMKAYVDNYDRFQKTLRLGPGLKTSQQFNLELRNLMPGFSLRERPSSKLGLSYKEIRDANINEVVNLLLFLEKNLIHIYAAYAPKRLGKLINHFAVPMIFEQVELLKELADLPPAQRTFERVRRLFVKYADRESGLVQYGKRASWKYRPFNMRKLFMLQEQAPTWVYPALEVRIPDTPQDGPQLRTYVNLAYALYEAGRHAVTTSQEIATAHERYREFLKNYRDTMPFEKAMRIINQDIASHSLTPSYREEYKQFIKGINLKSEDYPPLLGAEASPFVSQTYGVYGLIGPTASYTYAGRSVKIPEFEIPWNLDGFSFGAEFEFSDDNKALYNKIKDITFLEKSLTFEAASGNSEVITIATTDLKTAFVQIQYMRDVLGDNLRSIHLHMRMPKSLYNKIPKQKFDSWLARISDWVTSIRASYRNAKFAFRMRTQNRMQVDTPNGWIADDKNEYRGTMRILMVDDKIDIETRGLMDGVYKYSGLEPDLFIVSTLILLKGIHKPHLIEGNYLHRLVTEVRDPSRTLTDVMETFAKARGASLASAVHKPDDLVSILRAPNLMLLPLQGFEYIPLFSGHDVKRMQHATTNWKNEVWSILIDGHATLQQAQERFMESLKEWTKNSGLEHTLFDSLLVVPEPHHTWQQVNLPVERMQAGFLNKLVELQDGEFAKAGIELFIVTWARKDEKSFIKAASGLTEAHRARLGEIILSHETHRRARTLLTKIGISESGTKNIIETLTTNLDALLRKSGINLTPSTLLGITASQSRQPAPQAPVTEYDTPEARLFNLFGFSNPTPAPNPIPIPALPVQPNPLPARVVKRESEALGRLVSTTTDINSPQFISDVKEKYRILRDTRHLVQLNTALAYFKKATETHVLWETVDKEVWRIFFDLMWKNSPVEDRTHYISIYLGLLPLAWSSSQSKLIQPLLEVALEVPESERDKMFEVAQTLLVAYINEETNFGSNQSFEAKEAVRALKNISSSRALVAHLNKLAEHFANNNRCPLNTSWKMFVYLIDAAELDKEDRAYVLEPAVSSLVKHYMMKRNSMRSYQEGVNHLRALQPYITNEILSHNSNLASDFRYYKVPLSCRTTFFGP